MRSRAKLAVQGILIGFLLLLAWGCGDNAGPGPRPTPSPTPTATPTPTPAVITVNSLQDVATPPQGVVTLRAALADAVASGRPIVFDPTLSGQTIELSIVGEEHSVLKGEVYAGGPPSFQGYFDRDYGKSALYAHANITIDASALPEPVTVAWTGGDANRARVLAVYGDLTLRNVNITGGYSSAEALTGGTQPYTLARGGGIAVWGTATLQNCAIFGNKILGDDVASRDRGSYGGGIYANGLSITNCVISGNTATGYGAAGGGIYSVGGADNSNPFHTGNEVILERCTISGNRVTAQHAYGGGLFTLAGGPTNLAWLRIRNCTVARNVVEDSEAFVNTPGGQWYMRGGGIYMGGGSLEITGSTIAENEVTGEPAIISGKPNLGGGGIAATIGNAHTVEDLVIAHSIIAGNELNDAPADIFTGSLLDFYSEGYNLIGAIDFSQILVPIPAWGDLSRKHYPKVGDQDGVDLSDALDVANAEYHDIVLSAGTDEGSPALLWYPPATEALDRIPTGQYSVPYTTAQYEGYGTSNDDFLIHVMSDLLIRYQYQLKDGITFPPGYNINLNATWYGPAVTWPTNEQNADWISFWRALDIGLAGRLGTVGMGDDYWDGFPTGSVQPELSMTVSQGSRSAELLSTDQRNELRPAGAKGDIGAIEGPINN